MAKQEQLSWMSEDEFTNWIEARKIMDAIKEAQGLLPPTETIKFVNLMAYYYADASEKMGQYKSERDGFLGGLLIEDEKMSFSKAEALARGTDDGRRARFFEAQAAGYLEVINSLKKTLEYWNNASKDKY